VGVLFQADGKQIGSEVTGPPYSVTWNTSTVSNGAHRLTATARDSAGNQSTAFVTTNVNNSSSADTAPPSVTLAFPAAGATVSGSITISAAASDNVGVVGVLFQADGKQIGSEVTGPPYSVTWNTTAVSNGTHKLSAVARDAKNTRSTASVTVQVSNSSQSSGAAQVGTDTNTKFSVDVGDLSVLIGCANCGFQSAVDMIPGQATEVWLRPGTAPPVADHIILKKGAIEATITRVGINQFVIQPLPGTLWPRSIVVITGNVTQFLNFSSGSIKVGQQVAVYGLLFKSGTVGSPNVVAKKVELRSSSRVGGMGSYPGHCAAGRPRSERKCDD
jgi:hypothetical protein